MHMVQMVSILNSSTVYNYAVGSYWGAWTRGVNDIRLQFLFLTSSICDQVVLYLG